MNNNFLMELLKDFSLDQDKILAENEILSENILEFLIDNGYIGKRKIDKYFSNKYNLPIYSNELEEKEIINKYEDFIEFKDFIIIKAPYPNLMDYFEKLNKKIYINYNLFL